MCVLLFINNFGDHTMLSRPNLLSTTRLALRVLVTLNILFGIGIAALLAISLAVSAWLQVALGFHADAPPALMVGLRLIMLIGIVGVALAHIFFTRLLAIVQTVRDGDPFVPENALALKAIAWVQLGEQLLSLAVGAVSSAVSSPTDPLDMGGSGSVDGWLSVLLLFILARVFDLGTRMRAELEGTV
jgi:hypothetical protein